MRLAVVGGSTADLGDKNGGVADPVASVEPVRRLRMALLRRSAAALAEIPNSCSICFQVHPSKRRCRIARVIPSQRSSTSRSTTAVSIFRTSASVKEDSLKCSDAQMRHGSVLRAVLIRLK